jgi:hypothetical protein
VGRGGASIHQFVHVELTRTARLTPSMAGHVSVSIATRTR